MIWAWRLNIIDPVREVALQPFPGVVYIDSIGIVGYYRADRWINSGRATDQRLSFAAEMS